MKTKPTVKIKKLSSFTADPHNANRHTERGAGMMEASLREVGFADSLTVSRDGVILSGNQRHETGAAIGMDEAIVIESDGTRPIVHVRTDIESGTPEASKLALFANRVGEVNLSWDAGVLRQLQESVDMSSLWTSSELRDMMSAQNVFGNQGQTDPDEVPQLRGTSIVIGDVFALGTHRLVCGDSTRRDVVQSVMGSDRAGLMNTDPPYGIDYQGDALHPQGKALAKIENDDYFDAELQKFLEQVFGEAVSSALANNAAWYLWHAMLTQGFFAAAAAADVILHRQIIWVKPILVFGRGQYHWKHELAFMGWVRGSQPPDYGRGNGERDMTTVWEIGSVNRSEREDLGHPTPKPVELFEIPIVKHLRSGECCYEPFAGSGPQFIAAEKHGVSCRGIELVPSYCQVIIDRWEAFTGRRAEKIGHVEA